MVFSDKLNYIFTKTGFSASEVAREGNIDNALISKFRNGRRIPRSYSVQISKICAAIVLLADKNNCLDVLCRDFNITTGLDNHEIINTLEKWLNEDSDLKQEIEIVTKLTHLNKLSSFCTKLNSLISLFNISNAKLAKLLFIDASTLSRFRTGVTNPFNDNLTINKLSVALSELAMNLDDKTFNEKLTSLLYEIPPRNKEELTEIIRNWLTNAVPSDLPSNVNEMLERFFDEYKIGKTVPEHIMKAILHTKEPLYKDENCTGIVGFRKLFLQQLFLLASQDKPQTLYFYNNSALDRLFKDENFLKSYFILVTIIMQRNHHIFFVNALTSKVKPLIEVIEFFLPIYLSPQTHVVLHKNQVANDLSSVIMVVPNVCSINSFSISGTESEATYYFSVNKTKVNYRFKQLKYIMDICEPLFQKLDLYKHEDYSLYVKSRSDFLVSRKVLSNVLPISTMPKATFEKIIARHKLNNDELSLARNYYEHSYKLFEDSIKTKQIYHLVSIPSTNSYLSVELPVDLPIKDIYYTSSELLEHIDAIKNLLESNSENYKFYLTAYHVPPHAQVYLNDDKNVFLIKEHLYNSVFITKHPRITNGISVFIDSLTKKDGSDNYNYTISLEEFTQNIKDILD